MDLDHDACYRALATRDVRFDGRLFTGVRTTGVYCRPVCPVRIPKRENVLFFMSAAAAQAAGFRPCLRCRPEAAPDLAVWRGTSNTVARALSLIESGALDDADVEALAERLGVGERQLRRLFHTHLGASPIAVAQTRRVLLAKQLIHETTLPMTEVALASGFGSIRRFNETFKQLFDRPPGALRRRGIAAVSSEATGEVSLLLRYRSPYDWLALLAFLRARAIPGVEHVSADSYARTIDLDGVHGIVSVRLADVAAEDPAAEHAEPRMAARSLARSAARSAEGAAAPLIAPPTAGQAAPGHRRAGSRAGIVRTAGAPHGLAHITALRASIRFPSLSALPTIIARLRRVFDLAADPHAIGAHLAEDPALAPLVAARPGLRVPGAWDGFELAIRAVLGQQITVAAATGLAGKLVARYGEPLACHHADHAALTHVFPRAARLASADLTTLGMPRARAAALSGLASAVIADPLILSAHRSLEEAILRLRTLTGVGEWTAQYIAMRQLREPDAFPAADIGLMRAMADRDGRRPDPASLLARAERWRPWRAYAAQHLWASGASPVPAASAGTPAARTTRAPRATRTALAARPRPGSPIGDAQGRLKTVPKDVLTDASKDVSKDAHVYTLHQPDRAPRGVGDRHGHAAHAARAGRGGTDAGHADRARGARAGAGRAAALTR